MDIKRFVNKPEYIFRPQQIFRRVKAAFLPVGKDVEVTTPWKTALTVNPHETIGRSLYHMGIYDLSLSECIWRLAEPGTTAIDIGANIGYFSALLANRVGTTGKVYSYEPHPAIFKTLSLNLAPYSQCFSNNAALSNKVGHFDLVIPADFAKNQGTATLEANSSQPPSSKVSVQVKRLDEELHKNESIGLIKIDVEGHELAVFEGATSVLSRTRNILFEDFHGSKSQSIKYLEKVGFKVFRIKKGFLGPSLIAVEEGEKLPLWEPPNYLATKDENAARKALSAKGWMCL